MPIRNATGENSHPNSFRNDMSSGHQESVGVLRSGAESTDFTASKNQRISGLILARIASNIATNAMNTMSMAATLRASLRPSEVPLAAASITFTYGDFSAFMWTVPLVTG